MKQFDSQRKLGDDELISSFRQKLENSIEKKFESIVQENDDRRVFIVSTILIIERCTQDLFSE